MSPTDRKENVGFVQVAACAYICEMTHGYENEVNSSQSFFSTQLTAYLAPTTLLLIPLPLFQKFHDLIHCMLDNGALEQYPQV